MNKLSFILILIPFYFFADNVLAQPKISTELIETGNNKARVPGFDVHVGIGRVNGIRAGGRILVSNHISFEVAAGGSLPFGLINIAGFQSDTPIISLGINGHIPDDKHLTLSLISTFLKEFNKPFQLAYLSPNFGIMVLNEPGAHFFIRVGPYFEVNAFRFGGDIGVNLDLGLNFVI